MSVGSTGHYDVIEQRLREMNTRRKLLEKKSSLREATLAEFQHIRQDSHQRSLQALESQLYEAKKRNDALLRSATESVVMLGSSRNNPCLLNENGELVVTSRTNSSNKLNAALSKYKDAVHLMLPIWQQEQALRNEEELRRIRVEKQLAGYRLEQLTKAKTEESRMNDILAAEKKELLLQLTMQEKLKMAAQSEQILRREQELALNEAVMQEIEHAGLETYSNLTNATAEQAEQLRHYVHEYLGRSKELESTKLPKVSNLTMPRSQFYPEQTRSVFAESTNEENKYRQSKDRASVPAVRVNDLTGVDSKRDEMPKLTLQPVASLLSVLSAGSNLTNLTNLSHDQLLAAASATAESNDVRRRQSTAEDSEHQSRDEFDLPVLQRASSGEEEESGDELLTTSEVTPVVDVGLTASGNPTQPGPIPEISLITSNLNSIATSGANSDASNASSFDLTESLSRQPSSNSMANDDTSNSISSTNVGNVSSQIGVVLSPPQCYNAILAVFQQLTRELTSGKAFELVNAFDRASSKITRENIFRNTKSLSRVVNLLLLASTAPPLSSSSDNHWFDDVPLLEWIEALLELIRENAVLLVPKESFSGVVSVDKLTREQKRVGHYAWESWVVLMQHYSLIVAEQPSSIASIAKSLSSVLVLAVDEDERTRAERKSARNASPPKRAPVAVVVPVATPQSPPTTSLAVTAALSTPVRASSKPPLHRQTSNSSGSSASEKGRPSPGAVLTDAISAPISNLPTVPASKQSIAFDDEFDQSEQDPPRNPQYNLMSREGSPRNGEKPRKPQKPKQLSPTSTDGLIQQQQREQQPQQQQQQQPPPSSSSQPSSQPQQLSGDAPHVDARKPTAQQTKKQAALPFSPGSSPADSGFNDFTSLEPGRNLSILISPTASSKIGQETGRGEVVGGGGLPLSSGPASLELGSSSPTVIGASSRTGLDRSNAATSTATVVATSAAQNKAKLNTSAILNSSFRNTSFGGRSAALAKASELEEDEFDEEPDIFRPPLLKNLADAAKSVKNVPLQGSEDEFD